MGSATLPFSLQFGGAMFININSVNYFIITDGKSPNQIVTEIFLRMNKQFISKRERSDIFEQVLKQLQH
jgi:hypothetical protein